MWFKRQTLAQMRRELERELSLYEGLLELQHAVSRQNDDEISRQIGSILERWPNEFWAHYMSAVAYRKIGNLSKSIGEYAVAMAVDPDQPKPYKALARILRDVGQNVSADVLLERGWDRYSKVTGLVTEDDRQMFMGQNDRDQDE